MNNYSKRINCCYILEQCAINFEIPLTPPFSKGEILFPLFGKEGLGEILQFVLSSLSKD
jgi:hypothetical protein